MKRCPTKTLIEWYFLWLFWSFHVLSFVEISFLRLRAQEMDWIAFSHGFEAFHLIICQSFEADTVILFDSDWNPQASSKSVPKKIRKKYANFYEHLWIWSLIIFDLCDQISKWPSQADLQASDRAHRIGQTRLNGWMDWWDWRFKLESWTCFSESFWDVPWNFCLCEILVVWSQIPIESLCWYLMQSCDCWPYAPHSS